MSIPPLPSPSCSRASSDSGFLFSALVAFRVRGLVNALAAKPTVFKWASEVQAVRMQGLVAKFANEDESLIIATVAHDAGA